MTRFRFILIIFFAVHITCTTTAQNSFYKTLGHITEGSEGRNVAQAEDGGYFLTYYIYYASGYIACLTKLNCAGTKEWEKFYDGGMVTLPAQLIAQPDNGCLLTFSVQNNNGMWQHVVTRVDANGNQIWTNRIKMHVASITGSMTQDTDGSIYICGSDTIAPNGMYGTTVAKLNASGKLIWQKHYADGQSHTPLGLIVNSNHTIAVFGLAGFDSLPFSNLFVFTLTTDGVFLKRKIFSTYYDDEPSGICADKGGNIYITGNSYFINSAWDVMFLKLNSQLQIIQSKFIDGGTTMGEKPRYMLYTSDNSIAIVGDEGTFDERNPMLLKLNRDGNPIWSKRYPISPNFTNYVFHTAQCFDGGFLMTGDARPANQFRIAPFMKTKDDGDMSCFTNDFPITVRNETMPVLDTALSTYAVTNLPDTTAMPYSTQSLTTSNTTFCQLLVPCGNFSVEQDSVCPVACFTFSDHSINAGSWNWQFENGVPASSTSQNPPPVCFPEAGLHQVTLTLTNPIGSVTYSKFINVVNECPVFIPDIFTPNADNLNDIFYGKGITDNFTLQIFNRWGTVIYSCDLPGKWWDGNSDNGNQAPDGIYFYILNHRTSGKTYTGTVQLIR